MTERIIGAAIAVQRALGPGHLESTHKACLLYGLHQRGAVARNQLAIPVIYGDIEVEAGCKADVMVEDDLILELKSVESLLPTNRAQLCNDLRLSGKKTGQHINFNVELLREGIVRVANDF